MLVKSGMADIECGATSNLSSRQKLVTFSNTYFVAEVKVVAPADGAVRSLNDLANKRVVAIAGTSATRLIRQAAFARGLPVDVLEVRSAEDAFAALQSGKVDAYVGDDAIINQQRSEASNPGAFAILSESLSVEPYGLVLPLEDENFRRLVNQVLTGLMASGELERIYDKWFMSPIPPKGVALNMPISPMLKSVIQYPNDRPATY
jgi:glutamate/aspartate transport system substrate-binding protein